MTSTKSDYVFLSPPKTATRSISRTLNRCKGSKNHDVSATAPTPPTLPFQEPDIILSCDIHTTEP